MLQAVAPLVEQLLHGRRRLDAKRRVPLNRALAADRPFQVFRVRLDIRVLQLLPSP